MSKVIEMPLPLRTTVKKILAEKYVDFYIDHLTNGVNRETALFKAKFDLQEFVITSMFLMPHNIEELYKCFHEIRDDKEIQEKAQIRFELKNNEHLISKYMHLLTV